MHEQTTFLRRLDGRNPAYVFCAERGLPKSAEDGRSMGQSDSQHGAVVGDPAQHGMPFGTEACMHAMPDMGRVCQACVSGRSIQEECADQRIMDILGETALTEDGQIRFKEAPQEPALRLRTSEFVRVINATPLGPVLCERQLYRHRARAGGRFYLERRVDVAAYAAWLMDARHVTRGRRKSETLAFGDVKKLLQTQDHRCALSGRELTPETAALDHIVAVSRGGEHSISNAQVLHRDVNRAKGVLTNEEFVELCREVVSCADATVRQHQPMEDTDSRRGVNLDSSHQARRISRTTAPCQRTAPKHEEHIP